MTPMRVRRSSIWSCLVLTVDGVGASNGISPREEIDQHSVHATMLDNSKLLVAGMACRAKKGDSQD